MKRTLIAALAILGGVLETGAALAQTTPAAPAAAAPACLKTKITTAATVGELLANPVAWDIVTKRLPDLKGNDQIEQASGIPMRDLQQYAADVFTDAVLNGIDADLAKAVCGAAPAPAASGGSAQPASAAPAPKPAEPPKPATPAQPAAAPAARPGM